MAVKSAPVETRPQLSRWRINAVLLAICVFAFATSHKLFDVQVVRHEELAGLAAGEFRRDRRLLANRGLIKDSAGNILAMNVDRDSLAVTPPLVKPEEVDKLALLLAPLIGKAPEDLRALIGDRSREYVVLGRRLTPEASEQVRQLNNSALVLEPEPIRVYPHGTFAANLVGVSNHENVGISGVEGYANDLLAGVSGSIQAETDSAANPIWITPPNVQEPRDGSDLTLTIDPVAQRIAEQELARGIQEHGASGGSITVMDPDTGAILGMASWPPFDPNNYLEYPEEVYYRNAATTDTYEPGSTFKVVNLAIGLDAKAFTPESYVYDPGFIERAPGCCRNWDGTGHADMNPANVIYYSSNVGALQFAEMTGADRFYAGVKAFGYGEATGVEVMGEAAGSVQWPETTEDWRPIVLSTNGYGQGISVTPIQQLRAVAAVANGGRLMQPYLIKERCEQGACYKTEPKELRRVLDPATSETIKPMMVAVTNGNYAAMVWLNQCGAAPVPLVPGYNIASKTGTSSIPNGYGGYEDGATIGSIVGFAPAEKPKVAVLVKLDRTKDIWGVSAIPVYARVMEQLLNHYDAAPDPSLVDECQKQVAGQ